MREGYYGLGTALKQQSAALRKAGTPQRRGPATICSGRHRTRRRTAISMRSARAARGGAAPRRRHAEAHNLLGFILGQTRRPAFGAHAPGTRDRASTRVGRRALQPGRGVVVQRRQSESDRRAAGEHAARPGGRRGARVPRDWRCARAATSRARGEPAARDCPGAADGGRLCRSRITFLRGGELAKALGQLDAGLNLPPPALPAPDWDGAIAGASPGAVGGSDDAEAHNILGRVLGQKGADSADGRRGISRGHPAAARLRGGPQQSRARADSGRRRCRRDRCARGKRCALRPTTPTHDTNLGAALTPTDAPAAIRELEKAVCAGAAIGQGAVQSRDGVWRRSVRRVRRREIEQLRKVIALDATFARAHVALGKALLQDGKVAGGRRVAAGSDAPRAVKRRGSAISSASRWRARDARRTPRRRCRRAATLVAADDRNQQAALNAAEGRAALEQGDLEQAEAKLRRALELRPDFVEAKRDLAVCEKQRHSVAAPAVGSAPPIIGIAPPPPTAAAPLATAAAPPTIRSKWPSSRPTFATVSSRRSSRCWPHTSRSSPSSSWGWYALGYSQFGQQKIGEAIQGACEVAAAGYPQRRSAQDSWPQPDDDRPIRRGANRVRAGHPLQAGFGRDALQPRQAVFDSGQLGASAQVVRGRPSHRSFVCRSHRRARPRARGAWRRRRRRRDIREGHRAERRAARPLHQRPREPQRVLQPHRAIPTKRSSTRRRRWRSTANPTARFFRRRAPTSARAGSTTRSMR